MMNKDIAAVLARNKTEAFGIIEPFYCSICHAGNTSFLRIEVQGDKVIKKTAKAKCFAVRLQQKLH
jgi:hypothetical protein